MMMGTEAPGATTVQDKGLDALRMPSGQGRGDLPALGGAEHHQVLGAGRVRDCQGRPDLGVE